MIPCLIRRVVVAKHGIDFRKQINGLLAEAYRLGFDPYVGDCMVFVKKDRSQIRVLVGDEKGLYLISRRFEGSSIVLGDLLSKDSAGRNISTAELSLLFEGASFTVHRKVKSWHLLSSVQSPYDWILTINVGPQAIRRPAGLPCLVTSRQPSALRKSIESDFRADLSLEEQASAVIQWAEPDALVHLAGISNVSNNEPNRTEQIIAANVDTTRVLCKALRALNKPATFLFISSGLVYKPLIEQDIRCYDENSELGPVNDYGWSKLAAESNVNLYDGGSLKTYIARPFNHTGPRQDFRFVCPSLAQRIILANDGEKIPVGNIKAERDFTDVRDIARAYRLILEKQPTQRVFVLGSGQSYSIQEILNCFIEYSGKTISYEVAPELLRTEHARVLARPYLAEKILAWTPEISLNQTLRDVYDSVRIRCGVEC